MSAAPAAAAPPRRVVICGGGVVGACTAYFLSTHPTSPTVPTLIEKCAPACAASGKAGGFLALDWCDSTPALSGLARASFALHSRLADALGGAEAYGFRPVHTLSVLVPTHPKPAASPPRHHPRLPPWVDPSASAAPPRELGTPDTTAQVHPGLFTKAVLAASGAEVVIGEVERVVARDGRVAGVVVKGARRRGGRRRRRAGAWPVVWTARGRQRGVRRVRAQGAQHRAPAARAGEDHAALPLPQLPAGAEIPNPNSCRTTMLKLNCPIHFSAYSGEVYICGMSKDENPPDDPATITGEPDSIAMLHKIAGKVSSQLKKEEGAEVVAEQACYLPCTTDGLPVIGEIPGVKGCYVATGHSCWGILNGPATGAALPELILDGKAKIVDLEPFSPARFLKRRSRRGA